MSHYTAARAVKPAVKPLLPAMRGLLYVAAVLVFLAGCQLFIFSGRTASYFAWTIHNPLAAAFLGAGYWASVPFEALAARQRIWANARIAVPTVLVFTLLTLAATLAHLHLFHLGSHFAISTRFVTWAWLAIYITVPTLLVIIGIVQLRTPGADPPRSAPLIGFGVAAAHELAERDARRLVPASAGSVVLAVLQFIVLARYAGRFEWSSAAGVIYLVLLATMLITGAVGLALARSRPAAPAS